MIRVACSIATNACLRGRDSAGKHADLVRCRRGRAGVVLAFAGQAVLAEHLWELRSGRTELRRQVSAD